LAQPPSVTSKETHHIAQSELALRGKPLYTEDCPTVFYNRSQMLFKHLVKKIQQAENTFFGSILSPSLHVVS